MELVGQKTKAIMEGCKERARRAGLRFGDETLEYIVTNRDLIELSPKAMIPTMYDYWVHDVEVLREKGRYELYPSNPYETVINTRPAISFYNDNNPDWMNVMIFYHVLAHIDFFRNNLFFRATWDYDFAGHALSDKRMIATLRSEKGRWVDYIIEFSRGIDNLVGYHADLSRFDAPYQTPASKALDYYFDVYLQDVKKVSVSEYLKELDRYNACARDNGDNASERFFTEIRKKNPDFDSLLRKHLTRTDPPGRDLLQFLMKHSPVLKKEENAWMTLVIEAVRATSLFFQPQIRTKIMNEGWASYWHERLFLTDDRIAGHEVDFARTHSGVVSLPRVGMNPYALGMRMFHHIEELGDTGKFSLDFRRMTNARERRGYDKKTGDGRRLLFDVRETMCDELFIDSFIDQDFVDRHDLFVSDRRLDRNRMVWEYVVKSRDAGEYKRMLRGLLYHPPFIEVDERFSDGNRLYLNHRFEGKPLVAEYIGATMLGIEYLWGGPVELETSEVDSVSTVRESNGGDRAGQTSEIQWKRVVYTMKDRKLSKRDRGSE